jgi:molybdopterin molybdotransferase
LIKVSEAEAIILRHAFSPQAEALPLARAAGRILLEDLRADRDFPPFDRVTMDGIAICYERFAAGGRRFPIEAVQAAGMPRLRLQNAEKCIEVMTGAMLPEGADTVIRYEDLRMEAGFAEIAIDQVLFQQNLHFQGIDRKSGDVIVPRGRKIGPAEVATAATVGKAVLQVARLPRTAIVSTGDELVEVAKTPLPHQIRGSNVYALQALLWEQFRLESALFHYVDDEQTIAGGLTALLNEYDLVILSGAVSEGKFDFVPKVLHTLGVDKLFHKVSQRPGKPFWFGQHSGKTRIFALPGNPVSSFMCACRYLLPFLRHSLCQTEHSAESAVLMQDVVFNPDLTYFIPVKVDASAGGIQRARPLPGHGSGDLANLNDADGFLELPLERAHFQAGEDFPFIRYR